MDFPRYDFIPGLVTYHSFSFESVGTSVSTLNVSSSFGQGVARVYPTANLAIYIPIIVCEPVLIVKLFWMNGNVVSGNVDCGIYGIDGTRIISAGSTAQSGTNIVQAKDITDTLIGSGVYYLAIALDNTTGTFMTVQGPTTLGGAVLAGLGLAEQTTAFALPATATFATSTSNYLPHIGMTSRVLI